MNKSLLFLNVSTLVLVLLILIYLVFAGQSRPTPEVVQLSDSSLLESSILRSQSETIKHSQMLNDRMSALEQKVDVLLSDVDGKGSSANNSADSRTPASKDSREPELSSRDVELVDEAQSLASRIISSGTMTVEESANLRGKLGTLKSPSQVFMIHRAISVAINNDELKVEPGALF